jgi:soluble lytic murein transglycosylase-like protein
MIFHGVPLECINHAAEIFHIPATIIVAVMKIENGWNGAAIKNKNGTYDLGVMQVNTSWLKQIEKTGITREQLQYDACVNVHTATWILAKGLAKSEGWQGVGNYHSATPLHNKKYRQKVKMAYDKMQLALHKDSL